MGTRHCADCGTGASARARFCEFCGAALTAGAKPLRAPRTLEDRILGERTSIEGERKQVTVLYADIVGSMELTRALEAERWGFVLDRFLAIAAAAVHRFEGTVNQFTGDGLLAVFGAPLAHEDHARRACLAALELQREVTTLAAELNDADGEAFAVRCGLNSGEVIVGAIGDDVHMEFVPLGNTTALGKRIESVAPAGSTAISGSTAALVKGEFEVRELGEFEIKGVTGRQRVLELIAPGPAQTRLQATAATRGLSPFVGRAAEHAALQTALESARAGDGCAVAIVGDAGLGKSRLVHEFVTGCAAHGVRVVSTAAVAHGRYVPLLPVLALYRDYLGIAEDDAPEVTRGRIEATALALDPAFSDDLPLLFELFGVPDPDRSPAGGDTDDRGRRLLTLLSQIATARGRHEPVALVIEDLHWLDDASAEVLEALVAAVPGTRTIVVSTSRPQRGPARDRADPHLQIDLGPLAPAAADELLAGLLGGDGSLDGLAEMIATRADGNPFFIEEIVHALADNGHLSGARGAYRLAAELEGVVLPVTVQAALAARIDRLAPREKALVQTMSVIGNEIPGPLLSEISELAAGDLADAVQILVSAQWIVDFDAAGGLQYAFKHPLTREVAYGSQLSERRARAHRTVAAAVERTYPGGLDERAALIAYHCEASGDRLVAAGWHARAAGWAERTSMAESLRHWRRVRKLARELEPSGERDALAARARIGILSMAWRLGMPPDEVAAIRAEADEDAEHVRLGLISAATRLHTARERDGLVGFREASRQAVAAGDPASALTASIGVAYANWIAGSLAIGVDTIDRAIPLAAGDPMTGSGLVFVCPLAYAYSHRALCRGYAGEVDEALRDFDRALELARAHDDPETEAGAHAQRALLGADVGDWVSAADSARVGLEIAERAGNAAHIVACAVPLAMADLGAGRFADAVTRSESNLATIREDRFGLFYEPILLTTIARSKLALGEAGAAMAAAAEAVQIADARGLATCALGAPIALAHVLAATQGAAAGERIDGVLSRALLLAHGSGAQLFEAQVQRELAGLGRLRNEAITAER